MATPNDHDALPTLLLLSADAKLTSELERLLRSEARCAVQTAAEPSVAVELLTRTRVDLILLHIRMEEDDHLRFLRMCRENRRFSTLPVLVILEADDSAATARVLDEGANDCINFPCPMRELAARVRAHLRAAVERRRKLTGRRYNLSGDFTALGFTDLVGLLELGGVTGRLSILTVYGEGFIYFDQGRIFHATFGNMEGEEAFMLLMTQGTAQFEFAPGDWVADAALPRTIDTTIASLVMEGVRRIDESGVLLPTAQASPQPVSEAADPDDVLAAPMAPSFQIATHVEVLLMARRALGELRLMTRAQLRNWTSDGHPDHRLQCLLVTDLHCGVQALSALATPLSDDEIANTLRHYPQALAWSLPIDSHRRFDLVLVDQERPRALLDSLRRRPAVVVLAPSHGDFQTINLESRRALIDLLTRLSPTSFYGIGSADLEVQLREFIALAGLKVPVNTMVGSLWNLGVDPRAMLVEAVRVWAHAPVAQD
jgi:CheY-like chemotaxis protein